MKNVLFAFDQGALYHRELFKRFEAEFRQLRNEPPLVLGEADG